MSTRQRVPEQGPYRRVDLVDDAWHLPDRQAAAVHANVAFRTEPARIAGNAVGRTRCAGAVVDARLTSVAAALVLVAVVDDDLNPVGATGDQHHVPAHLCTKTLIREPGWHRIA